MNKKTTIRIEDSHFFFVSLPCHSEFCLFFNSNTKIDGISDMTKSETAFRCIGNYISTKL